MSSVVKWLPVRGGGSGSGLSSITIQVPLGTDPVLNGSGSIWTVTSTDLDITGDDITDSTVFDIKAGAITNAKVSASAAISYSKLATLNTGQILAGNAGTPTATTLGGDATIGATGTLTIANNAVSDAKLRQGVARSVIGRASNSTGNVADISTTSASNAVLRENGTGAISWGLLTNANIAASGTANIALNKLAATTVNKAAAFGSTGYLEASVTTLTELSYVSGATSNIQAQITTLSNASEHDISAFRRNIDSSWSKRHTLLHTAENFITGTPNNEIIYYFPFPVPLNGYKTEKFGIIEDVSGYVEAVVGIYLDDGGIPKTLIDSSVVTDGVTGLNETGATSITLDKGLYWLAIIFKINGGTVKFIESNKIAKYLGLSTSTLKPIVGYKQDFAWTGSLPSTAAPDLELDSSVTDSYPLPLLKFRAP